MPEYRRHWWEFWRRKCAPHLWRPGHVRFYPMMVCDNCKLQRRISEAEFYSRFGISFEAMCGQINSAIAKQLR